MSTKKLNINKLNGQRARSQMCKRAERVTLAIIRPNTGDLTHGYQFGIQTKEHLQLVGEIALGDKFNGNKHEKAPIEKICVQTLDYPHVLALGWKFCQESNYEPCRAIALFGEGASKAVTAYERICKHMQELKKRLANANNALLECVKEGKNGLKTLAKDANECAQVVKAYDPKFKRAQKEYRKMAQDAVAVLSSFDQLRK